MAKRKMAGRKTVVKKLAKKTGKKLAKKAGKKAARKNLARVGGMAAKRGAAKAAPKKKAAKKKAAASKKAPPKKAAGKVAARKAAPKKAAPRKAAPKKAAARKIPVRRAAPAVKKPAKVAAPIAKAAPKKAASKRSRPARATNTAPIRGAIPSSLVSGGSSSSARTGREELLQHIKEHNETSPAITAGDVDADWQLAYSSGDEAPGGDNPTPDQDVVDEIGEALGVNYDDGEELKGAFKIEDRDKHRWELDPASKDDFDE
jgi:hypothetical protein